MLETMVRGAKNAKRDLSKTPKNSKDSKKPAKDPESPLEHVLLRVRSENGQTINAHVEILSQRGSAMFGKMGPPIGHDLLNSLNEQIASRKKTFLFLTTREGWNGPYVTYQCLLERVYTGLPATSKGLVPAYYRADSKKINTWFEIGNIKKLSRDEMNKIFVVSSGRSVMSVIASSATVFRVRIND